MAKRKSTVRRTVQGITTPRGFRAAGGTCGIKASGRPDLTLIVADEPCVAAGVFTTSRTPSAPVLVGRAHLRRGKARAIICNSGNANASTGEQGLRDAEAMCRLVAERIGCDVREVLPSSTGIIGVPLPMDRIERGVEMLVPQLAVGPEADQAAAAGIMTTDLVPKSAFRSLQLGGVTVQLAGIAKGSGMIAPNMATMLAFITTDVAISGPMLRQALRQAAQGSFNRISVDQHTSPSDTVLALASGAAGNATINRRGQAFDAFTAALTDLCRDLAYQIVQDGEGATKVMRVIVQNARTEKDADRVAQAIVNSPLVKAAVHGGDPNWGRITTAAGYSGAAIDPQKMSLAIGDITVYEKGQPLKLPAATRRKLHGVMRGKEIVIRLDLGQGKAAVEWLGCDLSKQYVTINAEYTT